jgi:hypothetical protein
MSIDIIKTAEVIEALENYIDEIRPPEKLRSELDIAYKIENQSVIIYEIRPLYNKPEIIIEENIAKATWVKAKGYWKIFWERADLKWHTYSPHPIAQTIHEFVEVVEEDKYGCFWG